MIIIFIFGKYLAIPYIPHHHHHRRRPCSAAKYFLSAHHSPDNSDNFPNTKSFCDSLRHYHSQSRYGKPDSESLSTMTMVTPESQELNLRAPIPSCLTHQNKGRR